MNPTRPSSRAIRVAFADDDLFVRAGLRRFIASVVDFEYAGEAASAGNALALVQAAQIDVLVLDANMPDRSGLEILPQLRAMVPRMQVVVVSALPASAMAPLALRAGACAYLEKPVNPSVLEEAIRSAAAEALRAANDDGCGARDDASNEEGTPP